MAAVWLFSACSSSDSGSARSSDSSNAASIGVGGNDGWWVDAPLNSASSQIAVEEATASAEAQ